MTTWLLGSTSIVFSGLYYCAMIICTVSWLKYFCAVFDGTVRCNLAPCAAEGIFLGFGRDCSGRSVIVPASLHWRVVQSVQRMPAMPLLP